MCHRNTLFTNRMVLIKPYAFNNIQLICNQCQDSLPSSSQYSLKDIFHFSPEVRWQLSFKCPSPSCKNISNGRVGICKVFMSCWPLTQDLTQSVTNLWHECHTDSSQTNYCSFHTIKKQKCYLNCFMSLKVFPSDVD